MASQPYTYIQISKNNLSRPTPRPKNLLALELPALHHVNLRLLPPPGSLGAAPQAAALPPRLLPAPTSAARLLLLVLHPPVLEPDLHLLLGQPQTCRDLDPPQPGQVHVGGELPLQLEQLLAGERRPDPLAAGGGLRRGRGLAARPRGRALRQGGLRRGPGRGGVEGRRPQGGLVRRGRRRVEARGPLPGQAEREQVAADVAGRVGQQGHGGGLGPVARLSGAVADQGVDEEGPRHGGGG